MRISPRSADFAAFEQILHEGLQIYEVDLSSDQLMSNHYHLVIRPLIDGEMSRFMGWIGGRHKMRYHAHYHNSGLGHVYQQRYKSFPIQMELDAVRLFAHQGRPLGDKAWVESIA